MSKMKILTVDLETSPNLTWAWNNQLWQSPIPQNMVIEPSRTLTWAAKWLGNKKVYFRHENAPDFVTTLWQMMDEADVIVGYNSKKFDRKYISTMFFEEGMPPPSLSHDIDLYPIVRGKFQFPSYKLAYVAERLLPVGKLKHAGFGLWEAYMDGEAWAKKQMKEYNIQDAVITEMLYEKVLGWITNHPNHGLYVEDQENPICRNCGSDKVKKNGPEYDTTGVFAYERYKCTNCGANLRGRKSVKGKSKISKQVVK